MATAQIVANAPVMGPATRAFMTVMKEIVYLLEALMNPRKVMAEIEQIMLRQADEVEASDPAHAHALRVQARRVGLRWA